MNISTDNSFLLTDVIIKIRSLFISERIETRFLEKEKSISVSPLTIKVGNKGYAVIFRYGSVILINVLPSEEITFLKSLKSFLVNPLDFPKIEELELEIRSDSQDIIYGNKLYLPSINREQLQLISEVLSKSVALDYYESKIAKSFELIEPFAKNLKLSKRKSVPYISTGELLENIGESLINQHNMVGRIEVLDKPDLLWENPNLERLYLRLVDEFEIKERHFTLERKLQLIGTTAETILNIIQTRRNLRVEWYIVILIVVEIILTLYEFFG